MIAPASRVDRAYVCVSALCLTLGFTLGIVMGIREDFSWTHIHAHVNLVGGVVFGLWGLIYRAWPGMRASRLAWPQFWLAAAGAAIFLVGLPFAMFRQQPGGAIVGSLMLLAAALTFVWMILTVKDA